MLVYCYRYLDDQCNWKQQRKKICINQFDYEIKFDQGFTASSIYYTAVTGWGVVNFYNWADYIGESTIRDFEEEYGIKVNYDEYDSSEIVEAKLLAGNSGYDLVVHSVCIQKRLMPLKMFMKLILRNSQTLKNSTNANGNAR